MGTHAKVPSRQKTKRQVFLDRVVVRDNLDKVSDAHRQDRFIPDVPLQQQMSPGMGLKYGGPLYVPTYKDYGNFSRNLA